MATKLLLIFLASRLFFLTIAAFSPNFTKIDPGYLGSQVARGEPSWVWSWANMDGRHFVKIATLGYTGTNFAFFPLYPLLINLISGLINFTPITSGLFISTLATIASAFVMLKLVDLAKLKVSKLETLFLFFFFPFSFVLTSVYSDALFLFMIILSFYFARSSRWPLAAIFAFFASLTRLTGVALIPTLALEWWLQRKEQRFNLKTLKDYLRSGFIAPLAAFAGFASYPIYLQFQYGNWRLFQVSMSAWNQDKFILLPQVIFRYFKILLGVAPNSLVYWVAVLELVSFILYFLLAIYVFRKIRASYGLFMMILLLLLTFTGTFAGTPRYLAHLFPGFLGLAYLLSKHPRLRLIYYPTSFVLGVVLTALFVAGRFIS